MTPFIVVYIAAVASVVVSLIWVAAERAWANVCVRRWDRP